MIDQEKAISQVQRADRKTRHLFPRHWHDGVCGKGTESAERLDWCALRWGLCECVLKASALPVESQHLEPEWWRHWSNKTMKTTILAYLSGSRHWWPAGYGFACWSQVQNPIHWWRQDRGNTSQSCVSDGVFADKTVSSRIGSAAYIYCQSPDAEQTPPKKTEKTLVGFLQTSGAVSASVPHLWKRR